jgi:hypothetical protein
MDDNIVVFATTNEIFFNYNSIFYHMNKKTLTNMVNFVISIGLLSLQCTHPWVFHDIISNS